ncbi:MAG TPA: flagellar filament capping protein FliD [Candidatus Gastranaerophilales bacterium]|nr:flagellar filament capping protein FliD [Candidatus Gastranaerophilales bacterium]
MSMQFSGLGSGLPIQEWVDSLIQAESLRLEKYNTNKTKYQSSKTVLNSVESKFSSLRSALEKLTDANLASTMDLFVKKAGASSDDTIATARVANNAAVQKIDLQVERLATATTAKSLSEVGQIIDGSETFTTLANGAAKEGSFSFYIDGVKQEFEIEADDTLQDIADTINNAGITGLEVGINAGKFEIKIDDDEISSFNMGASSDTSNFLNVMRLATAEAQVISDDPYETLYTSVNSITKVDITKKIIGNEANLAGTFNEASYKFKIGGSEFTIDANTTFQDLISSINNDDDAGVLVSFDMRENKLKITSETAGETAINFEDTSGDFLEQMGLITPTGDSISSQTLGDNALVKINGSAQALEVNSNTLSADISGITGVTIKLLDVTEAGESIKISIDQDTEPLTTAMTSFVEKFNAVINEIDKETKSGQKLAGEQSVISLRNSLRSMATDMVGGLTKYNSFGMIGISTGDVGASVEEDTKTLEFDADAFLEALQTRPDEVKALLVGDKSKGIKGILEKLEAKVESSIDPVNGYFAAREDSYDASIKTINDSITREEERLETRRQYLLKKFNQMDQYISQMQQQQSALAML